MPAHGFRSDRQRKGFFGSRGNPRSNVNPRTIKKLKFRLKPNFPGAKGFIVNKKQLIEIAEDQIGRPVKSETEAIQIIRNSPLKISKIK